MILVPGQLGDALTPSTTIGINLAEVMRKIVEGAPPAPPHCRLVEPITSRIIVPCVSVELSRG